MLYVRGLSAKELSARQPGAAHLMASAVGFYDSLARVRSFTLSCCTLCLLLYLCRDGRWCGRQGMMVCDCEIKSGTLSGCRLNPNPAPVPLHDFLAGRQSNSRPLSYFAALPALEQTKNPFGIRRINADPVILHAEPPAVTFRGNGKVDFRLGVAVVLDRVPDEVLK